MLSIPEGCTALDGSRSIDLPGHYCLTNNLHARFEMADRWAERTLIGIHSDNVVLDLRDHYLTQNGKNVCITISDRTAGAKKIADAKNITIKNGTLRNCGIGVYQYSASDKGQRPTYDPQKNTYYFPGNEFHLENITFEDNKQNFRIRIPK